MRKHLNRIYRRNPENNTYIIDIRINHYQDLFNDLDPSPLRKRDLDQDFITYLEEASLEIPLKYPLDMEIHCAFSEELKEREDRIRQGLYNYFESLLHIRDRQIFLYVRRSLGYLVVGFVFLFLSFFLSKRLVDASYVNGILIEGSNIGGWVFVWEALATVAFKSGKIRKERKRILRLEKGEVNFRYEGKGALP